MKKRKKSGEPFDELNVVTSAGYEKGKRRDKSINKSAGLHGKKKEDDETTVCRRKPLAIKHKRRLRKAIPAVLAACSIAAVILITGSYKPAGSFDDLDGDYRTVCYETPTDGTTPCDHSVVETIGYLNYTLQNQPFWSSEMAQDVSAMFNIKQGVRNYKKSYNGNVISVDIAIGASSSARQFCVTDKAVLWRDAVDPAKTDGFDTKWKDGKPSGLNLSDFKKKRGLPPSDFSVYVLNENTVINAQEKSVVDNGDGTYSFTANLNVNTKYGEENNMHSAVYYYKQQMAVTGGLSQLPSYKYTNVTYTFDESYRVTNFTIEDSYEATMRIPGLGEVTSPCTSVTNTIFSYDEADCKNSVYEDCFKKYENDFGAATDEGGKFAVTATNCLAGAFSSVLSEGAVFKLNLGLGGKPVDGVVAVSLKDGGIDGLDLKLGNITAHMMNGVTGYDLYLDLGQGKYKVNIDTSSLSSGEEGSGDGLGNILDSLMGGEFTYDSASGLATLHSPLSLMGIDLDLKFAFKVNEEKEEISLVDVKADINYGNISLNATLAFGEEKDRPAKLTAADKALYSDILNDGVTVGLDLNLDGKIIKGVAKIDLADGQFAGLRAKLGEITVHYEGDTLYISVGENKYKLATSVFGGATLSAGGESGLTDILSGILENLTIENAIIKTQYPLELSGKTNTLDIALDLFDGVSASVDLDLFGGIGAKAYLCGDSGVPAKLGEEEKRGYSDIMNDGVTVGLDLNLDGKIIKGIAKIDLADGQFAGLRAKLGDAAVYFEDGTLYAYIGGSKIKLPVSALGATGGADNGGLNTDKLISDIVSGVSLENGVIKTQLALWQDSVADISIDLFGGLKISLGLELFGAKVGADAALSASRDLPGKLSAADKEEYVDVTKNFTLSGMLGVTLGGQQISVAVNNLALSLEGSLSFKLDATLLLNNTYNNFYAEYANGVLTVTYGAPQPMLIEGEEAEQQTVTLKLDIANGDLAALETAVVEVYNRVVAVYNEITKNNVQPVNSLSEVMKTLGIAKDGVNGMKEIFEKLAIPTDTNGNPDMNAILNTVALSSTNDGISVALGNIFAELKLSDSGIDCGANVKFGTSGFDLTLSDLTLRNYVDIDVPCENALDKDAIVDMLDYLGATADMLLEHTISVKLDGTLYDTDANYNECGNIKYKFNALLEYDDGGRMPVDYENGELHIDNTVYVHFNLALVAQNTAVDKSLYLDVYIMDANPNGTANGLTTGGYTPDNKSLDFYVSVSEFADGAQGSNPLRFYGSMDEVLGLVSMGVSMLNLDDIKTTSADVNNLVSSVYKLLDTMLIENYIPETKSQFSSLGESLLPQILKTDLSSLLNKLIAEYEKIKGGIEDKKEITEGNFIRSVSCADGRLEGTLNSANLFGVPEYDDLTFYVTKTTGEKTLISGVGIDNIYFGNSGEKRLNLSAGITYDAVTKPDTASAFKDYKNFAELDGLLATAVNSATHKTSEDEKAEGYLSEYKLNSHYCVGGEITLNILGNDIGVTINTLSVDIGKDNDVSFNINLSYSKEKFWGMVALLTDSATVDISINNGMVYIKKAVDGGAVTYRIMPVNTFMNDMFNQLTYVLSFSDTITSLADKFMSGSTEKVFPVFNDYGDYIDKFLSLYEYNAETSEWTLKLNGTTLSGMAGMSGLGDITLKLKGENGNLKDLSLAGSLSVINFSGTLTYLNPNEVFAEGKSDLSCNVADVVADGLHYSWAEILGGDTFGEIDKHFMWNAVAGGAGYLSYEGGALTFGGYTYLGASYLKDGGYEVGTLSSLKESGVSGVKLDALWMKSDISIKAGKSYNVWTVNYSYNLGANGVTLSFVGNPAVVGEITSISGKAFGYVNNGTSYEENQSNGQHTAYKDIAFTNDGGIFTAAGFDLATLKTGGKDYGHVAIDLSITCGGNTLTTWAHTCKKF